MRAFQRSRPQCFNPRFQCQLGHVTPGHAFLLTVCIIMLPMLVVGDEHVQLATTEPVILFGRWCVHPCHIFKHVPLMLPSLSNILPAMALQNVEVKSNIWCLSRSSSHTSVRRVSFSPGFSVPSGLVRMVVRVVVVLLLLMSGDIETNPGPVGSKLTTDNLGCVLEEVLDVSAQWYHLGLQLKVKTGTLDSIRAQFSRPRDQLLEMLKTWLTTGNDPSWQTLTDALGKDSVGASQLAHSLKAKYCNVERPEGDRGASPPSSSFSPRKTEKPASLEIPPILQADNETTGPYSPTAPHTETQKLEEVYPHSSRHSSSSSIDSPSSPFGCGCGKCTFFSFIEKGCPTPLSSTGFFPYLDLSGLTYEQQQGLKQRLCCESHDIMMQFQKLVRATVKSLTKQRIPLTELRSLVMTLGAFDPVYKKSQVSAFYHCFKDLEKANEVSDIFWILKDYFSFFNYHIIEHIISELGTEEDNRNLQTYKEQFDQYAKRRIYECLPWFGPISETGHVDVFVKVDSQYDNFSVKEVENFCWQLCRIYGITSHSVFRLCQVEKGCLQFMFQIPSFMQQELFPLSSEQETALVEEGVIKLTCGDYQFIPKEWKDSPTESGDVEQAPLQTAKVKEEKLQALIHEDLPGVPLYPMPVNDTKDLLRHGDHLIYQLCGKPYRPCYKSALVLRAENTKIQVIMNSSEGIIAEWLVYSDNFYVVKYSHCHYTNEQAVERAKRRLEWGEKCYHCLYNNSHHFVTWAKTGKEHSLADIIESLTCQKVNHLTPVLTKVPISDLRDVKEGDHIMTGTQHYLVASIDTEHNTFTGYTFKKAKVVKEEKALIALSTFRIEYEESFSSKEAIANAEQELEASEWSDSDKYGSDKFVTKMKTGKKYSFNEQCLFAKENQFSCTQIVPGIAVDEGDHLVVKGDNGKYQSVLVLKHASQSAFIVTPDPNSEIQERCSILVIEEDTEVYRINYQQSLPVVEVFQRAMSDKGFEVLRECKNETSKFVSWAKTGRKESIDVVQLKSQIAQICPFQREKILSVDEIQVGDHLIRSYRTYWWHFMVTEKYSGSFKFKTIYCNNHWISETVETINPSKEDVYRILYPESLPVATAIERARSRLGHHFSPLGRMWFVRWAKTGSDDGIEVNFLLNNAMPTSKSRVHTFSQLNPGDYLVEKENLQTTSHHYLVMEVTSHSSCSVIESWWTVKERVITFNEKSKYYRLNYNEGACISTEQVIANAQKPLGRRIITETQYKCHILVNYLKTGNAVRIRTSSLQDDRTLLRRERVSSALELRPGDHIECPMFSSGAEYHHMIVTEQPTHDKRCKVIHFESAVSKTEFIEEEVDIYEKGDNVFRIKYPERYTPDHTIEHLKMKCLEAYSKQLNPEDFDEYEYKKNTCEELIMKATVGERLSIQVTEHQRRALVHTTSAVVYTGRSLQKISTITARRAATKAVKASIKAIAKSGAKAATKAGAKVTPRASSATLSAEALFQQGFRSAVSGTAVGVATSVAAATNVAVEGPLLAKSVYELHRKKTFDQISSGEFKRGIVQESITSANTVVGSVGGAVLGQIAMPVPVVGAAVGGAVGGIVGHAFGKVEGWAVGRAISEPRPVTILPLVTLSFIDNPTKTEK